jgi:hypothetical protein
MLKVQSNGIGKGGAFHIATFTNKVFDFVAMTHRRNALGNDRTRVEFSRDVMRRGTDEFDAALMRTVIRLRTGKGRKERMMDVDHPSVPTKRDRFRENPHVAGQHHKIGFKFIEHCSKRTFLRCSRISSEATIDQTKRNAMLSGEFASRRFVGNDRNNVNIEFTE